MPTVMVSHVVLDVPTLFAVTLFITVIGGFLLLFAFLQNRNTPALALWGTVCLIGLVLGPALWLGAFQFASFAQSLQNRIGLVAAISASYALLAARELWYARDRELISRWPTLVMVIGHAGFLLARIPYAQEP